MTLRAPLKLRLVCISTALILALLCAFSLHLTHLSADHASNSRSVTLKSMSTASVTQAFTLRDFGSHVVKFGMLAGDGSVTAVFLQVNRSREVTCITAMSMRDGNVLWQRGVPSLRNFHTSGEIPSQVYDWNADGYDDVIFYENGQLVILHGLDGSMLASTPIEEPYSIFIYQTNQFGGPAGIVLHGRDFTSLLAPDLSAVWRHSNGFSHFPAAFDIDNDSEPELLSGYLLFRSDGLLLWNKTELKRHNDATDSSDVDCDGMREVAIATSGRSALLNSQGEILWRGVEHHSQHVSIGSFLPGTCEKQIATIDRDKEQRGILRMWDRTGKLLWKRQGFGNRAIMTRIENWIPEVQESLLLVFRSQADPPTLFDGDGDVIARFAFQPALKKKGSSKVFSHHFIQHFDVNGDGREEILVYNERSLWVYANKAIASISSEIIKPAQTLPNPRIFNSTFYMGMQ